MRMRGVVMVNLLRFKKESADGDDKHDRPDAHVLDGEGPAAALTMLSQDLDHLERILDI